MTELDGKRIAEKIIELDLRRDELFEELIALLGSSAYDLLRKTQNSTFNVK